MLRVCKTICSKNYLQTVIFLSNISLKRMYHGSYLGIIWSIIQPASYIAIMSLVMGHIMKFPMEDYSLLLMSGLVPWTLITAAATQGSMTLISAHAALKNTTLPKTIFITAEVLLQTYIFFIAFIAMYVVLVIGFASHRPTVFLMPLAAAPLIISSFSLGVLFAYVGPYMRDISHFLNVGFQTFFWLTPVVYPITMLPKYMQDLQEYNPFYVLLRPIQQVTYYAQLPTTHDITSAMFITIILCILAGWVAKKLRRNVIYYL